MEKEIKFNFGKYKGKKLDEVNDYNYFNWLVENEKFIPKKLIDDIKNRYSILKKQQPNTIYDPEQEYTKLLECKKLSDLSKINKVTKRGGFVYILHNIILDKYYVGQSENIIRRLLNYYECSEESSISKNLKKDIINYGRYNFEIQLIPCENERSEDMETKVIREYEFMKRDLYNINKRTK